MKLDITAGLARLGIAVLNPMQTAVEATDARRLMLLAPTGSGKTVAFALALIKRINPEPDTTVGLVVVPSRELAMQVASVLATLATGLKVTALYGGHSVVDERNSLSVTPDIVVGTPGRLLDHIRRGRLDIRSVQVLVLDEYDKSLELGFREEMEQLVALTNHPENIILTSATAAAEIPDFVDMAGAETIDYSASEQASAPAPQLQIMRVDSPARDKLDTLVALLRSVENGRIMVFVNHREAAERVYERLRQERMPAVLYHGGLDQLQRQRAIITFTNGSTPLMVTTDLGARGLDIDGVTTVIHYHLPSTPEAYTHRNGRTGRQGRSGQAFVIVSEADNVESYITYDSIYTTSGRSATPLKAKFATLYFDAGKREKISRGDIAGFLIAQGHIDPKEIGRIEVADHSAYAAVPRHRAKEILQAVSDKKIKNRRVRISLLNT